MNVKCPECRAKMFVVSKRGMEDVFQFECFTCGYIEEEEPIENTNDGKRGPLILRFNTELEFEKIMNDKAYEIHSRTVNEISRSIASDNDYVIIAYLNDRESVLGVVEEEYLGHVESARYYFEEIEDYEMCTECITLENKIKEL